MKPICLTQWFHARATDPERVLDRALRDVPDPLRPDVEVIAAWNRTEFATAVQNWMTDNTNTQYLLTVSHGILETETRKAMGIGSAPNRPDHSILDDEWIT